MIPLKARIGGYQVPVRESDGSNSNLSLLVFADATNYSFEKLPSKRRSEIRGAERRYEIRPFSGATEFADAAHPVYSNFFARTHYGFLKERLSREGFEKWTEAMYSAPGLLALGAFLEGNLAAASLSRRIGDTVMYISYFARDEALRNNVSGLMLHHVRLAAAETKEASQVYVGMRKFGSAQAVDDFYLLRGCTVQNVPSYLWLNPVAALTLRLARPDLLKLLKNTTAVNADFGT